MGARISDGGSILSHQILDLFHDLSGKKMGKLKFSRALVDISDSSNTNLSFSH